MDTTALRLKNGSLKYALVALVIGAGAGGGTGSLTANRELQDHLTRIQKLEETASARQVYITEFQQVQATLDRIVEDLREMKRWQADWPATGELRLDTKQNKDIEQLRIDLDKLERRMER